MFNVGGGEFLVIALVALIVLGPQRLPDAARQVGKAMGELRRMSTGFQAEIRDAISESDLSGSAPAPRRHALTAAVEESPAVSAAIEAVSEPGPKRRTPLRAVPLPKGAPPGGKGA